MPPKNKNAAADNADAAATNTADGAATEQTVDAAGQSADASATSTPGAAGVQTEGSAVNGQEAQPNTSVSEASQGASLNDVDSEAPKASVLVISTASGAEEKVPALWIRSVKPEGFRRCGFGFNAEGFGVALTAFTDEQIETLRAERNLVVEDITFSAEDVI